MRDSDEQVDIQHMREISHGFGKNDSYLFVLSQARLSWSDGSLLRLILVHSRPRGPWRCR